MGSLNRRPLLLVVAATVLAALFVGWIGSVAVAGGGLPGPVGLTAGLLLFLALLAVVWLALDGRRTAS